MDNEHPLQPRQPDEAVSRKADPIDTYTPGEISKRLDGELKTDTAEGSSRIERALAPVPEPTLETMLILHSSANPDMQLEYVERLANFEPAERQQVEEYVEKRRSDIWPLTEERLEQLYTMSQADGDAPIEAFAEQLRAMTPDQQSQFNEYRNGRIAEEAKALAESATPGTTQTTGQQQPRSRFESMPGSNATATPEEMRQQAQAMNMNQPNFMKDSPRPKWWQKIWRRKNR